MPFPEIQFITWRNENDLCESKLYVYVYVYTLKLYCQVNVSVLIRGPAVQLRPALLPKLKHR